MCGIQFHTRALPHGRERFVPRHGQKPRRYRRTRLEPPGLPPDIQKNVADDVLRHRLVSHQPQNEAVDAQLMSRKQGPHGELIALSDPPHQHHICG